MWTGKVLSPPLNVVYNNTYFIQTLWELEQNLNITSDFKFYAILLSLLFITEKTRAWEKLTSWGLFIGDFIRIDYVPLRTAIYPSLVSKFISWQINSFCYFFGQLRRKPLQFPTSILFLWGTQSSQKMIWKVFLLTVKPFKHIRIQKTIWKTCECGNAKMQRLSIC